MKNGISYIGTTSKRHFVGDKCAKAYSSISHSSGKMCSYNYPTYKAIQTHLSSVHTQRELCGWLQKHKQRKKAQRGVETPSRVHSLTLVEPGAAPRCSRRLSGKAFPQHQMSKHCSSYSGREMGGWNLAQQKQWFLLFGNKSPEE